MIRNGKGMWYRWIEWQCEVTNGFNAVLWSATSMYGITVIDTADLIRT